MTNIIRQQVLILGHGEMGHAMQYLLGPRHKLTIWERQPKDGAPSIDLQQAVATADFVLFCIPADPVFSLAEQIRPTLRQSCLCLSIAKGLDWEGRPAAQALQAALKDTATHGVLYGPMISEELLTGRPGFAQLGIARKSDSHRVQNLFAGSALYLKHSTDIAGLSWCAILKNVYAIAFGMADELKLGDNMRGYLAVAAMQELSRISVALGGTVQAPYDLAGLGDLVTTATSAGSHHHELGRLLVRGHREALQGEGINTVKQILRLSIFDTRPYRLFSLVADLITRPGDISDKIQTYLETTLR